MQDLIRSALYRRAIATSPTPHWFGLAIVIVILLGVLFATAARSYVAPLRKAGIIEVLSFAGTFRYDLIILHAERGQWPDVSDVIGPNTALADYESFGVIDIQMNRGSFNLVIDKNSNYFGTTVGSEQWNLSFLRQTLPGNVEAVAVWTCGLSAPILTGSRSDLPNLTNVPEEFLPSVCR